MAWKQASAAVTGRRPNQGEVAVTGRRMNHRRRDLVQAVSLGSNPSGGGRKSRCCALLSIEASRFGWRRKESICSLYMMAFAGKYQ
jgi:hypothetical protein